MHWFPFHLIFSNSPSSLCPLLLLCDWCGIILNNGFYSDSPNQCAERSLIFCIFSMCICLLSLKEAQCASVGSRSTWKSKSLVVRSLLGRRWSAAFAYWKDTCPNTERRPIFASLKAVDRWKKTSPYYKWTSKKKKSLPLPANVSFQPLMEIRPILPPPTKKEENWKDPAHPVLWGLWIEWPRSLPACPTYGGWIQKNPPSVRAITTGDHSICTAAATGLNEAVSSGSAVTHTLTHMCTQTQRQTPLHVAMYSFSS